MLTNQFEDFPRKSVCSDTQKVSIEHNYEQKTDQNDLRNSGIADAILKNPKFSEISTILKVGPMYRNAGSISFFVENYSFFH